MNTNSKIALVTGGSRGLGKNIAIRLAKKGVAVIITYYSKKDEAVNLVKKIEKLGGRATAMQQNLDEVKTFPFFSDKFPKSWNIILALSILITWTTMQELDCRFPLLIQLKSNSTN